MPKINRGSRPAVVSEGKKGEKSPAAFTVPAILGCSKSVANSTSAEVGTSVVSIKAADTEAATPITAGQCLKNPPSIVDKASELKVRNDIEAARKSLDRIITEQQKPAALQWVEGIDALLGPMTDEQKSTLVAVGVRTSPADRDAILGILRKCLGSKK